jgi:hypothetical protein
MASCLAATAHSPVAAIEELTLPMCYFLDRSYMADKPEFTRGMVFIFLELRHHNTMQNWLGRLNLAAQLLTPNWLLEQTALASRRQVCEHQMLVECTKGLVLGV